MVGREEQLSGVETAHANLTRRTGQRLLAGFLFAAPDDDTICPQCGGWGHVKIMQWVADQPLGSDPPLE